MIDAIWRAGDIDIPVVVKSYLGKGPDGRQYVAIEGSNAGIPIDELYFIESDDPVNIDISELIDPNH